MTKGPRNHVDDLRGATRLAIEATVGVTDLVEAMHHTIGGGPSLLGQPLARPIRFFTEPIYATIRGVARRVGSGIDLALAQLAQLVGEGAAGPDRETVLAVLNGVLGDYLAASGNPLAIAMQLRHAGQPLAQTAEALRAQLPAATGKLVVLVHGSCCSDAQWLRRGHDHGAALARDLGYTPVRVFYNSGLHISTNGAALAAELEQLVASWPVPVDALAIVGHSMGGLVARSACRAGELAGHRWRRQLGALVCLGAPHHGALLERGGNLVDILLGVSRYSAPLSRLGKIRSAGVTDLRFGNVLDEHWQGRDRFAFGGDTRSPLPLPDGVACFAVAGTTAAAPGGALPGDGLVSVDSALGVHKRPELTLAFAEPRRFVAYATGHLDLLDSAAVYGQLRTWLADASGRPSI